MGAKNRADLKALWVTGYTPSQSNFSDLFDSFLNLISDNWNQAAARSMCHSGTETSMDNIGSNYPWIEVEMFFSNPKMTTININSNPYIKAIEFNVYLPAVTTLQLQNNILLQSFIFSGIISSAALNISGCPQLQIIRSQVSGINALNCANDVLLEEITLISSSFQALDATTQLQNCSNIKIINLNNNTILDTCYIPLDTLTDIDLSNCTALPIFNITGCYLLKNITLRNCTSLNNIDFSVLSSCTNIDAFNCGLSETTVNTILIALDINGLSSGFVDLSSGTSIAPTGAGITAAANLITKSWTVNTN